MGIFRLIKLAYLLPVIFAISSCSPSPEIPAEDSAWVIPDPPENSDHGYLLEDNRIPSLTTCEEWDQFWTLGGPAVSFEVAKRNPQVLALAVSTQVFLKNQILDSDSNGILCDEDIAIQGEPIVDEDQKASPNNPESDLVEAVVSQIRSFRKTGENFELELDSFSGPNVERDVFDHYIGSVERAAKFWAQFNDGQSLVRSVTVVANDEQRVLLQRIEELGLPPSIAADWWPRAAEYGGGTVFQADDGYSHVFFRLKPGRGDKPYDDYAFHEITHSYQDGLGAISGTKDFPCWFGEGYAMVVGHANNSPSDDENLRRYRQWQGETIQILGEYFSNQNESLALELAKALNYGHSNETCNTQEPLFGYRLGRLVSEVWIGEFGFEATIAFMKNIEDFEFEAQFEKDFGISMDDWLYTRALPQIYEMLRADLPSPSN